ncbi:MAG: hypothetical protein ACI8YQ_000037 [Polaribacter sp.]|jgi:hypothetical protein
MDNKLTIQTTELIARDFGLELSDEPLTEEDLLNLVANEVAYMLEHRIDFLMSLLYRLDVLEHKINHVLSPFCTEHANIALAKLIIDRQHKRIISKRQYKQTKPDDMEGWEF